MTILIATGLRSEARVMSRHGLTAIAGGGDAAALEARLDAQASGSAIIISSGLGGALAPDLKVGDIVIDGGTAPNTFVSALLARVPGMRRGTIIGSDTAVTSAGAKAALHAANKASVVDMESHVTARVAARYGRPFLALRVISDAATDALPEAALAGMKPDGSTAPLAVLAHLARDPRQLPALLRTARNAALAMRVLSGVYGRLDLVLNVSEHFIDMV